MKEIRNKIVKKLSIFLISIGFILIVVLPLTGTILYFNSQTIENTKKSFQKDKILNCNGMLIQEKKGWEIKGSYLINKKHDYYNVINLTECEAFN
jgi:hypothetical protein